MICVIAVDIFAVILAVDDAEVWCIARTAVCHAGTVHAHLTARTWRSLAAVAACTAVVVIGFGIDAFDGACGSACAHIHITGITGILTGTAGTRAGCRIGNGMIRTPVIACTAMI